MPVPAYVSTGPSVADNTYGWPTSVTVGAGDAPSGVSVGDRVFLVTWAMTSNKPTGFDHFHVDAPWTHIWGFAAVGGGTPRLDVWTTRWEAGLLPTVVESHDSSHGSIGPDAGNVYRTWGVCGVVAYSPSYDYGGYDHGVTSGSNPLAQNPPVVGSGTFAADGTAVAFGIMAGTGLTLPHHTANGFTEQLRVWATSYQSGSPLTAVHFVVADKAMTSGNSTNAIRWARAPVSAGATGCQLLVQLDAPDPPIVTPGGWSVGMIQW